MRNCEIGKGSIVKSMATTSAADSAKLCRKTFDHFKKQYGDILPLFHFSSFACISHLIM